MDCTGLEISFSRSVLRRRETKPRDRKFSLRGHGAGDAGARTGSLASGISGQCLPPRKRRPAESAAGESQLVGHIVLEGCGS